MARRFDYYRTNRGDNLGDPEHWNKRFEDLDLRVHARELDGAKIDEAVEKLTNVALQRLNDTFTPVVEEAMRRLAEVGAVFAAESLTEATIEPGAKSFVLTQGTRASFVLTDYVSARPVGLSDRGMVCNVVSYDRATGLLVLEPVEGHVVGDGTYDAWTIRVTASPDVEHASRADNPHQVTAVQVGAYTATETDAIVAAVIGSAGAALDTLGEIQDALGNDPDLAATIATALGLRLRVDAPQSFTGSQKIQGLTNLGIAAGFSGLFWKSDPASVAFAKTGVGTVSIKAGTVIELAGLIYSFAADTAVQMPSLTGGTDYAIYMCNDGTVRADANFSAPTGFSTTDSRQIGGFHYAPGGNATGTSGGDTTPAINTYSIWDLKWRPACADPRGMALVAGRFWTDIYLCGVDHHANGTSRYNVTIADGSTPPKIPAMFGGNGTTAYSTLTWFEASLVMQSAGKSLLSYGEFVAACYGTTEASSGGADPVSTILRASYTSKWGVMLATGNLWQWSRESAPAIAAFLGGSWSSGAGSGSRVSDWLTAPSHSSATLGARGRSDHLHHV